MAKQAVRSGRAGREQGRQLESAGMSVRRGVLFVLAHANHYNCFLPVVRALAADGHPVACAIPQEVVVKRRLTTGQLAALGECGDVRILRRTLLERLLGRLRPRFFSRPLRWARRVARCAKRLAPPPHTVVVPLHPANFHRLRDAVGPAPRIVCLQHDPYLGLEPDKSLDRFPVDLFCAWGEHMKAFLESHGSRAAIHITGAPHLSREPGRRQIHEVGETVHLLYATQPAPAFPGAEGIPAELKHRAIRHLLAALRALPAVQLTVKFHPIDDGRIEADMTETASDLAGRVRLAPHDPAVPIDRYIDASDLVVTIFSTVSMESMVQGKPVILLNYDNIIASIPGPFRSERDYLSERSALEARDGASLLEALRGVLYDPAIRERLREGRERFLDKHLQYDSATAVSNIVRQLIEPTAGLETSRLPSRPSGLLRRRQV